MFTETPAKTSTMDFGETTQWVTSILFHLHQMGYTSSPTFDRIHLVDGPRHNYASGQEFFVRYHAWHTNPTRRERSHVWITFYQSEFGPLSLVDDILIWNRDFDLPVPNSAPAGVIEYLGRVVQFSSASIGMPPCLHRRPWQAVGAPIQHWHAESEFAIALRKSHTNLGPLPEFTDEGRNAGDLDVIAQAIKVRLAKAKSSIFTEHQVANLIAGNDRLLRDTIVFVDNELWVRRFLIQD